jgi:hypothetical protein
MTVVSCADLPHVLVLFVVWAETRFIGGVVADEESRAYSGDSQAADENDDDDGGVGDTHGGASERETGISLCRD